MKTKQFTLTLLCMIFLASWQSKVIAQKADTLTVTGSGTSGALMQGDLYRFIDGDTLPNGSRKNPNRFYRLERGKAYLVNATMYFKYDVNIIADNDNPNSPVRPPMLINGKLADGSNNMIMIALMKSKTKCLFKNIFFQGVTIDKKEEDDNTAISMGGDSIRLAVNGCVFNALGANCIVMWGKGNKLYITNNKFRNGVRAHPFKGQLIVNSGAMPHDTLVMTNNTSFNNNSYLWAPLSAIINYERVEHNTVFTSIVNIFYSPWMVNAQIKDNLFYGILSYGQKQTEVDGGWYDFQKSLSSIISLTKASAYQLGQHGFTEAGRKIDVSNNNYFWPQRIKDNWTTNGLIASDSWMNTRTAGYFADKTTYPYLAGNNELNVDPQFNATMEKAVLDSVIAWVNNFRQNYLSTYRNYNVGSTNLLLPTWPLPENLTYTNSQLLTAGHDGLPLGDLNWFPAAKAQWELLNKLTAVQNVESNPNFQLSNYPNPTNAMTRFTFKLGENTNINLRIFNIEGKHVATVLNGRYNAGTHSIEYNASQLSSGVYICELVAGNYSTKSKLVVTK